MIGKPSSERPHLFAESDRGREPPPPPPEPRRSLTERFRPETLSAYIPGAGGGEDGGDERVGFLRRGAERRRGQGQNGNRRDAEVFSGNFLRQAPV